MAFNIVQHRRGAEATWQELNLVPADGELIIVEFADGSRRFKLGDGITSFKALSYLDGEIISRLSTFEDLLNNSEKSLKNLKTAQKVFQEDLLGLRQEVEQTSDTLNESIQNLIAESVQNLTDGFEAADERVLAQAEAADEIILAQAKAADTRVLAEAEASASVKVAEAEAKVAALQDVIKDINTITADITEHVNGIIQNLNANIAKAEQLDSEIEALKATDDILDSKIAAVVDTHEKYVQDNSLSISNNFSQVNQQITNLREEFKQADTLLNENFETEMSAAEQRITENLAELATQHGTDFSKVSEQLAAVDLKIAEIEDQNSTQKSDLVALDSKLNNEISALKQKDNILIEEQARLADLETNLENSLENVQKEVNSLRDTSKEENNNLNFNLTELEYRVTDAEKDINKLEEGHKNCETSITSLESRLEDIDSLNNEFKQDISNLSKDLVVTVKNISNTAEALNVLNAQHEKDYVDVNAEISLVKENIQVTKENILDELQKHTEEYQTNIDNLYRDHILLVESLNTTTGKLRQDLSDLKKYVDLETGLVGNRFLKIEDILDKLQAKLDENIDSLNNLLSDAIQNRLAPTEEKLTAATSTIEILDEELGTITRDVEDLNERLSDAEIDIITSSSAILALSTRCETRIGDLEGRLMNVTNVMDFRGVVSVPEDLIATNEYQNGDVVIDTGSGKEYVVNDGKFIEFGWAEGNAAAIAKIQKIIGEGSGENSDSSQGLISDIHTLQNRTAELSKKDIELKTLITDIIKENGTIDNKIAALTAAGGAVKANSDAISDIQLNFAKFVPKLYEEDSNIGSLQIGSDRIVFDCGEAIDAETEIYPDGGNAVNIIIFDCGTAFEIAGGNI